MGRGENRAEPCGRRKLDALTCPYSKQKVVCPETFTMCIEMVMTLRVSPDVQR